MMLVKTFFGIPYDDRVHMVSTANYTDANKINIKVSFTNKGNKKEYVLYTKNSDRLIINPALRLEITDDTGQNVIQCPIRLIKGHIPLKREYTAIRPNDTLSSNISISKKDLYLDNNSLTCPVNSSSIKSGKIHVNVIYDDQFNYHIRLVNSITL